MFGAIVHGLGRLLAAFYDLIPSYGMAIILLTVVVRVAMIPLAIKQAHIMEKNRGNAEKMRKLMPELRKLKEKYRDDRNRLYEEQRKLYEQHEVNMFGQLSGCLPVIVQMPVFMAMYSVLQGCNKLFGSDRICELGYHIPDGSALKGAIVAGRDTFLSMNLNLLPSEVLGSAGFVRALPYYLLVALMGYTMWYQSRQMMKAQPAVDEQMRQTQKIMQFMPLMLVFFSLNFPAGLTVYWTASNVWSIGQQGLLMRRYGPLSKRANQEASVVEAPSGGLMGRLKALMPAPAEKAQDVEEVPGGSAVDAVKEAKPKPERARAASPKEPDAAGAGPDSDEAKGGGAKGATRRAASRGPSSGGSTPTRTRQPARSDKGSAATQSRSSAGSGTKASAAKGGGAGAAKRPAAGAAHKPAAGGAGARAGTRSGGGAARQAAGRGRTGAAGSGGKAPGSGASKSAGGSAGAKPAAGGAAGAPGAGRPKGSGARKKGRSGHR